MNLKINKVTIFYLFYFIPFFKPVGLEIFPVINSIYIGWKLISLCIGILLITLRILDNKINIYKNDSWIIGLFLFFLIYFLNELNSGALVTAISSIIVILELIIILSSSETTSKRKNMYDALDFLFSITLFLQIISVFYIRAGHIIFRNIEGDYIYLLGTDNYSAFATIPMLGAVLFFDYRNKKKIFKLKNIFLCIGLCISYIYTGSVTAAIISIITTLAYAITKHNKLLLKLFTIKRIALACIVILFLIVVFHAQNWILWLIAIVGKGDKASTLNSRTIIWEKALNIIGHNPIFGIGELSTAQVESYALYGVNHAHNLILDLLLKTGIIGTISYLFFYIGFVSQYLKKTLKSSGFILVITLVAYFVLSMMDDYPFIPYIYCCFGLLLGHVKYD